MSESRLGITIDTDLDLSQRKTIAHALDLLGSALADHGHEWSDEERQACEAAHRELLRMGEPSPRKGGPCVGSLAGREVAVSYLSDRELNEHVCRELHRMRDELHEMRYSQQAMVNRSTRLREQART